MAVMLCLGGGGTENGIKREKGKIVEQEMHNILGKWGEWNICEFFMTSKRNFNPMRSAGQITSGIYV